MEVIPYEVLGLVLEFLVGDVLDWMIIDKVSRKFRDTLRIGHFSLRFEHPWDRLFKNPVLSGWHREQGIDACEYIYNIYVDKDDIPGLVATVSGDITPTAVSLGQISVLDKLLSLGQRLNEHALMWAIVRKRLGVLQWLLERGYVSPYDIYESVKLTEHVHIIDWIQGVIRSRAIV